MRKASSGGATIGSGVSADRRHGGGTLELAGSISQLSQAANISNAGSAVLISSKRANQNVGTSHRERAVLTVNAGASLTAYQIVQNSLTINGTGTTAATAGAVTLVPSGSGSTSNPTGPNNINFSSTLTSLSIANNGAPIGSGNTVYYGTLDIGNNGLVIAYGNLPDPYAAIDDMIRSGFDYGHWDGAGITSSLGRAAADSHTPLNIGLEDFTPGVGNYPAATTFIVFEGQSITTRCRPRAIDLHG